eukprot:1717191-Heterocapsa_arctica.AAC.1
MFGLQSETQERKRSPRRQHGTIETRVEEGTKSGMVEHHDTRTINTTRAITTSEGLRSPLKVLLNDPARTGSAAHDQAGLKRSVV